MRSKFGERRGLVCRLAGLVAGICRRIGAPSLSLGRLVGGSR